MDAASRWRVVISSSRRLPAQFHLVSPHEHARTTSFGAYVLKLVVFGKSARTERRCRRRAAWASCRTRNVLGRQALAASARHRSAVESSAGNVHSILNSSIVTSRDVPKVVMVEKNLNT
jgi:hypothetical protein